MKKLRQEVITSKSKYFIKETQYTDYRVGNISWRRTKILVNRSPNTLFLRGLDKKNNVKWKGYGGRANYIRSKRCLYLTTVIELSRIEIEED